MKQDKTNKTLVHNRQASHEYFILERYEVGMCLTGDEVKSVKAGNANLKEAFIYAEDGGIVIKNMHISPYEKTDGFTKNSPRRDRKLLMHKQEILKVRQKVEKKGLTLIPLSMYGHRSLWVTIWPVLTMCCPPAARLGSSRPCR